MCIYVCCWWQDLARRYETRLLKSSLLGTLDQKLIIIDISVDLSQLIINYKSYVQHLKLTLDMKVEESMILVFHPEVQTRCHWRVHNSPIKELCAFATDNIKSIYTPMHFKSRISPWQYFFCMTVLCILLSLDRKGKRNGKKELLANYKPIHKRMA